MNCWVVLDLDANASIQAIKKAYAEKLKENKPDENPEGFKQLHAAYKEASRLIKLKNSPVKVWDKPRLPEAFTTSTEEVETPNQFKPNEVMQQKFSELEEGLEENRHVSIRPRLECKESFESREKPIDTLEQQAREHHSYDSIESLELKVYETLSNDSLTNKLSNWTFLENADALYDLVDRTKFSLFLFNRIIASLRIKVRIDQEILIYLNLKVKIDREILIYLNSLFAWTHQVDSLSSPYDQVDVEYYKRSMQAPIDQFKATYIPPKRHLGAFEYTTRWCRFKAFFLDIGVLSSVLVAASSIAHFFGFSGIDSIDFYLFLAFFVLVFPVMEVSLFQATPGMMLMGIKVVTKKGNKLNIFHSLFRSLLFVLCTIAFKITALINVWLLDADYLLHDKMSLTRVIKR